MGEMILVVDDEQNVLEVVQRFLKRWGYDTALARNAAEARELLRNEDFALLLTDIKMPGASGLELTRYVKSTYPDMIVIFLNGLEDQNTAQAAMETGAYAYLTKPLRYNEMLLFIRNGLQHRRLEMENRRYVEELESKVQDRTRELELSLAELQASQEAIKESEEKFRVAIEHSNDGILMHHHVRILYANAKFAEMFGAQSPDDYIDQDITTIVHPDDREWISEITTRCERGETVPERYEFRGLRKDGRPVDLEVSVARTRYQERPVTLAFFRDVTSRKADRKALEDSEERLRIILDAVQAGILIIDRKDKTIVQANPVVLKMIGVQEEQILERDAKLFSARLKRSAARLSTLAVRSIKAKISSSRFMAKRSIF